MSKRYLVCLDPGHGPDTVNGSPDGTYQEKEFTWDLYTRIRPLLEQQGVSVIGTRTEQEKPSLTARAQVSNAAGADLFLSLHSNAAGGAGWSDARGFLIYTSSGPETAARNRAAMAIISQARAGEVLVRGTGLLYEAYTVLVKTTAPACLIEYGFHTNQEDTALLKDPAYREQLARITAKGVCDYLGVPWTDGGEMEPPASGWAAEAWEKAVYQGIFDGSDPRGGMTREMTAVVLDRLGLLG